MSIISGFMELQKSLDLFLKEIKLNIGIMLYDIEMQCYVWSVNGLVMIQECPQKICQDLPHWKEIQTGARLHPFCFILSPSPLVSPLSGAFWSDD